VRERKEWKEWDREGWEVGGREAGREARREGSCGSPGVHYHHAQPSTTNPTCMFLITSQGTHLA